MFRSMGASKRRLAVALLTVVSATVVAQEPTAEQKAFVEQMRALDWVKGPTTVEVQGNSKLTIPDKYVFLDAANAKKFLELQHNSSDGREVMVAPHAGDSRVQGALVGIRPA